MLQKYAHALWWGSLGVLASVCVLALIGVWVSGRGETDDAFGSGRRLLIALDTGEMTGKNLTLDKPIPAPPPAPETPPLQTSPAETPPSEPSAPPPENGEASPAESAAPALPPDAVLPPATPTAEPNTALMEEGTSGKLPVIGKDGDKPWRYYSKPFERTRNQPMVAIVVSGLGTGRTVTQDALQLPENFSISFSPYARDIAGWAPAIRATGHELLVDLPLQPTNYPASDPGPQGLLLEKGPEVAEHRLQWAMSRFPAFIGMLTPQNESFTANDEGMKALLQSFANRGLLLVMGKEPYRKETRDIIDATHTATLIADLLIDEELSPVVIQQRLTQLEEQAKRNGYAIGVAQAYPLTLEQLRAWAATLEEKGVVLVPISAIAKLRFS